MADQFQNMADELTSASRRMFLITPHASNEVNPLPKAIRCDVAGTVALRSIDATADVSITMSAGEVLPVRAQYIRVTGTTATLHGMA